MKKLLETIKNNPIWIGVFGICCLVGFMAVYQLYASRSIPESKYLTQELQREATVEEYNDPEIVISYFLQALQNRDLDQALRAFAMDESILNVSLSDIINTEGQFYTDMEITPSGDYDVYCELSAIELAGKYAQSIQAVWDSFSDGTDIQIKNIDYVQPEVQLTNEHRSENEKTIEAWGGDCICEAMVLLESGDTEYLLGFTMNHYEEYWKILWLGSRLTGTTEEEPVRVSNVNEYMELRGESEKKEFQKNLEKEFIDIELFTKEESGEAEKILKGKPYEDRLYLLPANYSVINTLKENSPQKVIEKFTLGIEKKDLVSAMGYCMRVNPEELEHTTFDILQRQKEVAIGLKKFCYGLLGCDYQQQEGRLEQIGESGSKISDQLDPQYFMYMDLIDIFLANDTKNEKQYIVVYRYEGELFAVGMTLVDEEGWQIKDLSMSDDYLTLNEVEKISEKKYEELKKIYGRN